MAFIQFIGDGNGGSPSQILINADRIDAVNAVEHGAKCAIFIGGSDTPFWINESFQHVVGKLQKSGSNVLCNYAEYEDACMDSSYNHFIDYVKRVKETKEDR